MDAWVNGEVAFADEAAARDYEGGTPRHVKLYRDDGEWFDKMRIQPLQPDDVSSIKSVWAVVQRGCGYVEALFLEEWGAMFVSKDLDEKAVEMAHDGDTSHDEYVAVYDYTKIPFVM